MGYKLRKGDHVELLKPDPNYGSNSSCTVAYYLATVLRPPALQKNLVFVEYHHHQQQEDTDDDIELIMVKGYVDLKIVRPAPPPQLHQCFKVGDDVDVYFDKHKLWRRAIVEDVLEYSKYKLTFIINNSQQQQHDHVHVVDHWNLRLHRDWTDDGSWVPPLDLFQQKNQLPNTQMKKPPKNLKLKITLRNTSMSMIPAPPEASAFKIGQLVEVSSDEEGFKGAWFLAKVIHCKPNANFLIEYLTLKTDDESQPLREEIHIDYIRPLPPQLPPPPCYHRLQLVDALYNDGWWVGMISKILKHSRYIVYFHTSNEEMEFQHSNLRPHQDWIAGKWKIASKLYQKVVCCAWKQLKWLCFEKHALSEPKSTAIKKLKIVINKEAPKAEFHEGMKVEVKSDEPGYEDSWYSALIAESIGKGKYLVEYLTLKTDDGSKLLVEEAKASDIRPYPPNIRRPYSYTLLEMVDVWYNDGWWVGQIGRVLSRQRYSVYFKKTCEELEFDHSHLRPHIEWFDGKWSPASWA
ncbi:hypothetical protein ACFE04_016079 [Oxalis oulophora]